MAWVHKYPYISDTDLNNMIKLIPCISRVQNLIIHGFCDTYMEHIINSFLKRIVGRIGEWNNIILHVNIDKKTEISLCMRQSTSHTEIDVNDIGTNHRQFIYTILKKIIQNMSLSKNIELSHKFIILYNVNKLSKNAQIALKSLIEYHAGCTQFILITASIGSISNTLLSHFYVYKCVFPQTNEILDYLKNILVKENIELDIGILNGILETHLPDIEKCVHALYHKAYDRKDDVCECLNEICHSILKGKYKEIRENIYTLIVNNIPCSQIIKDLTLIMITNPIISNRTKHHIISSGAKFEHRLYYSERELYHVEGFTSYCVWLTENIKH